jgi:hypothetical protein
MKRKLFLIGLVIPLWVFSLAGSAMPTPFPSTGEVYPFFNNVWDYSTLKGTALYSFSWDYNAVPNSVSLQFRGDTFNLSQMNVNNFSLLTPSGNDQYEHRNHHPDPRTSHPNPARFGFGRYFWIQE